MIGRRGAQVKTFRFPPVSHLKQVNAASLVEVLVVAFIFLIIISALYLLVVTSEFSIAVTGAKHQLQEEVRRIAGWVAKDARAASLIEINSNSPSAEHIKFRKVIGIDNASGDYLFSSDYTEYEYDSPAQALTRRQVDASGSVLSSSVFNDITQSPFYSAGGIPLVAGDILATKKLIAVIAARRLVRGSLETDFEITEEIKIRNE